MTAAEVERVGAIYGPLLSALILGLTRRRLRRQFPACLLSLLWSMASLVALERLNQVAGWWSFPDTGTLFCGLPLELLIGWGVLWGAVPQLAFRRLPLPLVAAIMAALDLLLMPACGAIVHLGPRWLVGEAAAIAVVLIPGLCLARWTLEDSHLRLRAALQLALSGVIFLFLLPEIAFALRPGRGWSPLIEMPGWRRQLELQLALLLALPGVSAVLEFAERGKGTPIPYDPPKRLVTSGIYRYCANPMQLSCGAVMFLWAAILQNGWLALPALLSLVYSAGIARWDEREDLLRRYGSRWVHYRECVHDWLPRWRPYHDGPPAHLYLDASCGPCSELQRWLEKATPLGLVLLDAGALPAGSILRLRYDPQDGTGPVEGVRALARALEHLHLGWALAGAALRLPGVWQVVQLFMDASGFGPRMKEAHPLCSQTAIENAELRAE